MVFHFWGQAVPVAFRGANRRVAEFLLQLAQVEAVFQPTDSVAVAQAQHADRAADPGTLASVAQDGL